MHLHIALRIQYKTTVSYNLISRGLTMFKFEYTAIIFPTLPDIIVLT